MEQSVSPYYSLSIQCSGMVGVEGQMVRRKIDGLVGLIDAKLDKDQFVNALASFASPNGESSRPGSTELQ